VDQRVRWQVPDSRAPPGAFGVFDEVRDPVRVVGSLLRPDRGDRLERQVDRPGCSGPHRGGVGLCVPDQKALDVEADQDAGERDSKRDSGEQLRANPHGQRVYTSA